jgi:hypothetical protein
MTEKSGEVSRITNDMVTTPTTSGIEKNKMARGNNPFCQLIKIYRVVVGFIYT